MKVPNSLNHCQQLLASHTVLAFRLIQTPTEIGYHPLLSTLNLREHSTDAIVACICIEYEPSIRIGVAEYR